MGHSEVVMAHHESRDEYIHGILKGRRTRRRRTHRLPSPAATMTESISAGSTNEEEGEEEEEEEGEEDLANCLILLAQGQALDTTTSGHGDGEDDKFVGGKATGAGNTTDYVYRCRTCNKRFYSFQALGGHRTSHKRPKTSPSTMGLMERKRGVGVLGYDHKMSLASCPDNRGIGGSCATQVSTTAITAAGKSRSHECSICGLDFSSGQALGGHMRRHRPTVLPAFSQESKKEKSAFDLDLNLPAPPDDKPESSSSAATFPLAGKQEPLRLPAMLDCHY